MKASQHFVRCANTGEQAAFTVVAKDQKGVRKSLGGDTFALSWTRAGSGDQPHAGRVCWSPTASQY